MELLISFPIEEEVAATAVDTAQTAWDSFVSHRSKDGPLLGRSASCSFSIERASVPLLRAALKLEAAEPESEEPKARAAFAAIRAGLMVAQALQGFSPQLQPSEVDCSDQDAVSLPMRVFSEGTKAEDCWPFLERTHTMLAPQHMTQNWPAGGMEVTFLSGEKPPAVYAKWAAANASFISKLCSGESPEEGIEIFERS